MLQASDGSLIPDTLGDRTPLVAGASYYGNSALALSGTFASYAAIYKRQLWVNVLVSKLAMAHARLPFGIRLPDGRGGWTADNGDLADLMRAPNPRMSGFHWWIWMSSTYDIYGEAYAIKIRDLRGRVRELWPMHPENLRIERDAEGEIWYVHNTARVNGAQARWHENDVIRIVSYNPDNILRGLSKLEPLRMTLLNEDASRRATASFWQRGARPGVLLEHPKTLTDVALMHLQQQFDATAGADNFGGTKVLEEGMQAKIVQLNLEEMQYIASRQLNREEACAAYDVPPPVVHILDRATFSNITEQLRSLYRDTMAPRNEMFEAVIDQQLVPDFYGSDAGAESRFDMDEVLRGDFETRATAIAPLIEKGVYKPAEARPLFGLPPAGDEADVLYGNAALVPLGSNARPQQVATDGTLLPQALLPVEPVPKAIAVRALTVRSIMGRLSQVKTAGIAAMREKLVTEHAKELRSFFSKQKAAVLGGTKAVTFRPADWDTELAEILETLSIATTTSIGGATAAALGAKYDATAIADWVSEDAKKSAENLNATTASQLQAIAARVDEDDELDEGDEYERYFDEVLDSRADEIAGTRVGMLAGFASLVAAGQAGASRKTWIVTSANPRASHAAVAGETVGINETFSNGLNAPGDYTGGADEVAGCTCELQFEFEE